MKNAVLWFVLFFSFNAFADTLSSYDYARSKRVEFLDSGVFNFYDYEISEKPTDTGSYELRANGKVDFLLLHRKNKKAEKFLCLHNDEMIVLYSEKQAEPFIIGFSSLNLAESVAAISDKKVSASSFLVENKNRYPPENLKSLALSKPWIENADGYGIGEYVEIEEWTSLNMIVFCGYVSYERPDLFAANSRPKTIEVEETKSGRKVVFHLADTPNPQKLSFTQQNRLTGKIRISVKEVYAGEKWKDTCINCIMQR